MKFVENVVHGLRSRGWSLIDAETEAEDRLEKRRAAMIEAKLEERL